MSSSGLPVILAADDDDDDRLLLSDAFEEIAVPVDLRLVADGVELLDYLHHANGHNAANAPRPSVILLDLNMPRLDGRDALQRIKTDRALRSIPVLVLTTSRAESDISLMFERGASAYIPKPETYEGLVQITKTLYSYWLRISLLPHAVPATAEPADLEAETLV